jgi:prepilin-type N-terminal cleavage/methylation domain-containing protein
MLWLSERDTTASTLRTRNLRSTSSMESSPVIAGRSIAFTLIELLIVIGIIALLAAIAIPNFLEAQVRAKTSRAKAELRAIATALEAYCTDHNAYPLNDGRFNVVPISLSTPVAFITNTRLVDPFNENEFDPTHGILIRFYTYDKIVNFKDFINDASAGYPPPVEAVDLPTLNAGALRKYGGWRLVSFGPDRRYSNRSAFAGIDPILFGSDILYDPTNGTLSWGNILRTQKSAIGLMQ